MPSPLLASFALAASLGACAPSPPTVEQARAALSARAEDVERLDDALKTAVAERGLIEAYSDGDLRFIDRVSVRDRRRAAFRERELPRIAREAGALSLRVTLRRAVDSGDEAGALGTAGDATRARAGESATVGGRRFTTAVYRTEGGEDVRAVEVAWDLDVDARVAVVAVLPVE